MKLGVILPHTKLYGGVKRFVELGNIFVSKGHEFFIYTPDGEPPVWGDFKGEMGMFNELDKEELDALFFTEPKFLPQMLKALAKRKIFYFVRGNENLNKLKVYPEIEFFANSTNMLNLAKQKFKVDAFKAFGGVDIKSYKSKTKITRNQEEPFIVMVYGRIAEKWKGTMIVVKACERLYRKKKNIKLILFDTPVNEKMKSKIEKFNTIVPHIFILNHPVNKNNELFHMADVFVAAEKRNKAGWSNTTAEAMASGIPVIATSAGNNDFLFHNQTGLIVKRNRFSIAKAIDRLIDSEDLRLKLASTGREKIEEFDWRILAEKIITNLENSDS